ncbi:MAG TPA: hypothetical protein VFE45_00710, partial [Coriobacteriia bacterium]|nr:hypothetical protein [Coriobacteriia bacterium]
RALELLEKARLAERPDKSKDEFTIKYGRVLVPGSAHSELHMLLLDRLFGKGSPAASTNMTAEQETLFGELAPGS